jgi:hypothetical protein
LPVIKRSHPEKKCPLPPSGTKWAGIINMHFPGLLWDSCGGDALFLKRYTHINTRLVRGFEFFIFTLYMKRYIKYFLKALK